MSKRKICVVITARPSYSRIRSAVLAIQSHSDLELQVVVAASALLERYGNTVDIIRSEGITVNEQVYMVLEGENLTSMAKTTGIGILELSTVFDNLKPDAVITVADRYETIATAIAAAYMDIPVIHIQGGEVTGSIDEKVRHAVTKLADIHLVSSKLAAERVKKMGEEPDSIHITGCPSIDIAAEMLQNPELDFNPMEKYGGVGPAIDFSKGYLVVMQHPVTSEYLQAYDNITATLEVIVELGYPTFWFWPNVDAGSDGTSKAIRTVRELQNPSNIHFFKNMAPRDFLKLLHNSSGIVGNSSVAIRECSFLGVPAVNIGSRQSGRDRGPNVIDVAYTRQDIRSGIDQILSQPRPDRSTIYGEGDSGGKIADILAKIPLTTVKRLTY